MCHPVTRPAEEQNEIFNPVVVKSTGAYKRFSGHRAGPITRCVINMSTQFRATTQPD